MAKNIDEGRLAKRYARALFDLYDHDQLESAAEGLKEVADTWQQNDMLRSSMLNPSTPVKEREAVLKEITTMVVQNDERLQNFILVLLHNHRLDILPAISIEFSHRLSALKKQLSLVVTSAFPLSDEEKTDFTRSAEQQFGSLVQVDWKTDSSLLGGLVIKAGDTVLDNSVSGSLEKMRSSLLM